MKTISYIDTVACKVTCMSVILYPMLHYITLCYLVVSSPIQSVTHIDQPVTLISHSTSCKQVFVDALP